MSSGKSDQAFRTITEAAEILDLPAHVLRFWESKFKHIKPMKRGGGRRYYRPEDINLLLGIKHLLYSEGLTIKGTQKAIQSNGIKSIAKLGTTLVTGKNSGHSKAKTEKVAVKSNQSFKSFNLDNKKLLPNVDRKELENVFNELQKVRNRMQNRFENNKGLL